MSVYLFSLEQIENIYDQVVSYKKNLYPIIEDSFLYLKFYNLNIEDFSCERQKFFKKDISDTVLIALFREIAKANYMAYVRVQGYGNNQTYDLHEFNKKVSDYKFKSDKENLKTPLLIVIKHLKELKNNTIDSTGSNMLSKSCTELLDLIIDGLVDILISVFDEKQYTEIFKSEHIHYI